MFRKLVVKIILLAERLRRRFFTFHTRPMFGYESRYNGKENAWDSQCAIIIQGGLKRDNDFTLESVKLYHRHYPSATIILSTWKGEDVSGFEPFLGERFLILQSTKPSIPGPHNINMQIVSTKTGIDKAVEKGFLYVLKTRADQRLYGIETLRFMRNLLNFFPVKGQTSQKQRMVSTASGTSKVWAYHFSDLVMFGNALDMQKYWEVNLTETSSIKGFVPEQYLLTQYLAKTGWEVKDTLDDFMGALGARCIIVDNEAIDAYWPKYAAIWREYRLKNYFSPRLEINFKTWLNEAYIPAKQ